MFMGFFFFLSKDELAVAISMADSKPPHFAWQHSDDCSGLLSEGSSRGELLLQKGLLSSVVQLEYPMPKPVPMPNMMGQGRRLNRRSEATAPMPSPPPILTAVSAMHRSTLSPRTSSDFTVAAILSLRNDQCCDQDDLF
eukprot:TRINITY_DN349_c0_g1_i1.p1 TRINITY_DN349_c0_g1~~TRINITY_DN349_c0_g1_i1.p1  ORF type:complete len:139 (+),score=19.20 TRINITY_DN349_c0_g1_i1:229-645(+)